MSAVDRLQSVWMPLFVLIALLSVGYLVYRQTSGDEVSENVRNSHAEDLKASKDVILKTFVESCQKIRITIPLEAGVITQSDDLRILKGRVENRGNVPVQFVSVQVTWRDKDDKALDYDRVYATVEKILKPGESAHFQISKHNMLIQRCSAKVVDWWVSS